MLAVIAAVGGFAEAAYARRSAVPGAIVDSGRRLWVVHGAELTDTAMAGYTTDPVLRVGFTITNTALATDNYLTPGVVELILPDGPVPAGDLIWRMYPRTFALQPDIPADAYLQIDIDPARGVLGRSVLVRIHDEVPSTSEITTTSWRLAGDATDIVVAVRDVRGGR